MTNSIGYSTILGITGNVSFVGPIGPTGSTGATGTTGTTGATGTDSNYITEVLIDDVGFVTFKLSDGEFKGIGTLKGPTAPYRGITAISLGSGIPILRGVSSGITLEFYNFKPQGLISIITDTDGSLKFSVNANTTAGGMSAGCIENTILFAESKNYTMSTYLIPEGTTSGTRVGNTGNVFINFGGLTGGRGVVADITESILSVGPIARGERAVTIEPFFQSGTSGITLDLSYATVYKLITPIGINSFTTNNSSQENGQIMSVTLIIEGDDVWNFPTNVYFDEESKPVFYPGTNILHLWKHYEDTNWKAHFTARGFGVSEVNSPGLRGSCCYSDSDGTKHCEDYVTANYCLERSGTFEALIPCNKNSCIVLNQEIYDGICCSEGKCLNDIDPSLCQTIGGYFISGITCGDYPDPIEEDPNNLNSLCYKKCSQATICCKDGSCLGNLTKIHCEEILGGKIVIANDCVEAKCCDHIKVNGACCIPEEDGTYRCEIVNSPYECNAELGGVFMGNNTNCVNNICCRIPIGTCYDCVQDATGCNCNPISIYSGTCESNNYNENCDSCVAKNCYRCNCTTNQCEQIEACNVCPDGYEEGSCSQTSNPCGEITKTCYKSCQNNVCDSVTVTLDSTCEGNCQQLAESGIVGSEYINDICNCSVLGNAACFWCFPWAGNESPDEADYNPENFTIFNWLNVVQRRSQAPYRSVILVNQEIIDSLESETVQGFNINSKNGTKPVLIDPSNGIKYYDEIWTFTSIPSEDKVDSSLHRFGNYHVTSYIGRFRCYYIGQYDYNPTTPEDNRSNCLSAFGYSGEGQVTLCDPVPQVTYQPIFSEVTKTVEKIEPYQEELDSGIYAPFPPVWGRISYARGFGSCGSGNYRKATTNLRLMNNTMITELCNAAKTGELKYYMDTIVQRYENTPVILRSNFRIAIKEALGNEIYNGGIVENSTEVVGEYCVNDETSLLPSTTRYLKYDPYLMGPSSLTSLNPKYGANFAEVFMKNCCECSNNIHGGWYVPKFNAKISDDATIPDGVTPIDNSADMYYPSQTLISGNNSEYGTGEVYYTDTSFLESTGSTTLIPKGIFGRNLRYNLTSFNTSTLFRKRSDDSQVMFQTSLVSIPIDYLVAWNIQNPSTCNPGGQANWCPCISCDADAGSGEEDCSSISLGSVGAGGDAGENASAWSSGGLIVPSILTSPFRSISTTNSNQAQSKSVLLESGLCVDVLCPECYSYESC